MKKAVLVESPSNLGLREPSPGKEPGVKRLPDWLRKQGLHEAIGFEDSIRIDSPSYSPETDKETGILNVDSLVSHALNQAEEIKKLLDDDKLPLVLGGDCSIMIGSAIALKQSGDYALFYLDGHTDFMDISLSETGGAGGMAASLATGRGHSKLSDILGLSPYIKEENLWCVGNREYNEPYENEIINSNANYINLRNLRSMGIETCLRSFLREVSDRQLDGFWIHVDVDVLDDRLMPCVDSRTPDGLTYEEFNQLTFGLFASRMLSGIEITILDPDLDPTGEYAREFVAQLASAFNRARGQ